METVEFTGFGTRTKMHNSAAQPFSDPCEKTINLLQQLFNLCGPLAPTGNKRSISTPFLKMGAMGQSKLEEIAPEKVSRYLNRTL